MILHTGETETSRKGKRLAGAEGEVTQNGELVAASCRAIPSLFPSSCPAVAAGIAVAASPMLAAPIPRARPVGSLDPAPKIVFSNAGAS
jgi:hypothetical protein